VLFATNFSYGRRAELEDKLRGAGIDPAGGVVTSAMAAARLVEMGERVHVCGGPGVTEAILARGATVAGPGEPADAVIVGFHREFDFERLDAAFQAVRGGARLLATNDDATYPVPGGALPGGGSIVAAVAYASGSDPVFAGKPYQPMADLVAELAAGPIEMMVGDRPSTDGRFATTLGAPFGLVLSGVTASADASAPPAPAFVGDDLAALVRSMLDGGSGQ
jgi:glycerol-1-phosphatase